MELLDRLNGLEKTEQYAYATQYIFNACLNLQLY